MIGERALVLPIYGGGAAAKAAVGKSLPFRNNDALYYLDYSEGLLAVDESQLDTFVAELTKVEQQSAGLSSNPLLMFDAVLTRMVSPSASGMGQSFVRNAVAYRQAALACGVRLAEIEKQAFPESLDQIQIQGVQVAALKPPGKKPFGYEVDAETGNAFIWGYDTRFTDEVPDERPAADGTSPNFDNTVWELSPHSDKSP